MKDLHVFISIHVNQKIRKMWWESYGAVDWGVEFPKLRIAAMKMAYKQQTVRQWCQVPPNIAYRFDSGHKYSMRSMMELIE